MPDFFTLTCPSCGGKLQITNDIDRFACGHCGTEHIVKRGGGVVTLVPILNEIKNVSMGVDKTASELAIARLKKDVRDIQFLIRKEENRIQNVRKTILTVIALMGIGIISIAFQYKPFGIVCLVLGVLMILLIIWAISRAKKSILDYEEDLADINKELNSHLRKVRLPG